MTIRKILLLVKILKILNISGLSLFGFLSQSFFSNDECMNGTGCFYDAFVSAFYYFVVNAIQIDFTIKTYNGGPVRVVYNI